MKDIQEIMNEMNSVADEIAQTLDLGLTCTCDATCSSGTAGISVCGTSSNVVTSTCVITIPTGFTLASDTATIAYSLDSLSAFVEQCNCTATGTTKFDVRIVGPIPYVVNLPINVTDICTSPTSASVSLCCSGVANVNNILGFSCDQTSALIASGIINGSLNCTNITVTTSVNTSISGLAIVTVTFTLPACTSSTVALTAE